MRAESDSGMIGILESLFGVIMPRRPAVLLVLCVLSVLSTGVAAQPGEIAPGDNLTIRGIPKIPAEIGQKVNRYTEFRAATFVAWHPTKREMLITTRFGDTG